MVTKQTQRRRGAAIVEMAIVIPLLMLLIFGVLEYGWAFVKASQINNAARQGVRAAVRPAADVAEVEAAVEDVLDQGNIDDATHTIDIDELNGDVGEPVTVTVTVDYDDIALTGFGMLPLPDNLIGQATMAKEGAP